MTYRFALDIGTNSIGWTVFHLGTDGEPHGLEDTGVRVFTDGRDPQNGASLSADRRTARGARRRQDRGRRRRDDLMRALIEHGLMPADEQERKALERLDPYRLRAEGLDGPLPLHHVGRALFHLHKRRGFQSNRKAEAGDKEVGPIKEAAERLERLMADSGARTLGEYLYLEQGAGRSARARPRQEGNKTVYPFYPTRDLVRAEFDALWARQAPHHDAMTDAAHEAISGVLFRQRPLATPTVGKCALDPAKADMDQDPDGYRAAWARPLAQRFRILSEVNHLRIVAPDQTTRLPGAGERADLLARLYRGENPTFNGLRKAMGLPDGYRFNLEDGKRKGLEGDRTARVLAHKNLFGKAWHTLSLARQGEIVERLLEEEDEAALVQWLMDDCGLSRDAAARAADASLPDGHCRLGRRALSAVVPVLEDTGLTYAEAAAEAGYHHADRRPAATCARLPYYGQALADHVVGTGHPADKPEKRYGRLPNPTVHIALNQVRRVVNKLVETYGRPAQMVVEVSRDLPLGAEDRAAKQREQSRNQKANDARRQAAAEALGLPPEQVRAGDVMKLRLWEDLDPSDPKGRLCPYCDDPAPLSLNQVLADAVEDDHILPFSRTLDNSANNRTVAHRACNRAKGNRSPWEAFSRQPDLWPVIAERAAHMPAAKAWRFTEDAMDRFESAERDFLDRQAHDTSYIGRLAHQYLAHLVGAEQVWVVPGRLTGLLRRKWDLNGLLEPEGGGKNRDDHRHHAIDAAVVGVTSRSMLKRIADANPAERERLVIPHPWNSFHAELADALGRIVVSHKPDHGVSHAPDPHTTDGKLHEDTNYGPVADPRAAGGCNLVFRKPLESLTAGEVDRVRDPDLRAELADWLNRAVAAGHKRAEALSWFRQEKGIRRVRLLKANSSAVPIYHKAGEHVRWIVPGENHHVDLFELPDGARWGRGVSVLAAHRPDQFPPAPVPEGARHLMRLHKNDMVQLTAVEGAPVMLVAQINIRAGRVRLAPHAAGGSLQKRHDDSNDPFRWTFATWDYLRRAGARRVVVDAIGRVHPKEPKG